MRVHLFVFLLCFTGITAAWTQISDFRFQHLPFNEGPASQTLYALIKDSKGLMWMGSTNGLYRFDGQHYDAFRHNSDTSSLPNNKVTDVCEDKQGNIWGTTDNGMFRYSPGTNRFTHYSTLYKTHAPPMENILCDQQGIIWAGGVGGLWYFQPKEDRE